MYITSTIAVALTSGKITVKACDICTATTDVKATKIGLLVCVECRKPIAMVHSVFGGKVERVKGVDDE